MATSLATFSAFALNNRPANLEINRNGAVNFNGASLPSVVSQNWIPSIDNTYDLGENSTPRRWRDLWISRNISAVGAVTAGALTVANNAIFTNGNVYIGGNGLSNYNSNTPNIGTNGSGRWGALWITTINTTGLVTAAAINVSSLAVTGTQPALFSGFVLPSNAGALDLGSSGLPWRDLYITGNVYKNGAVYNPGLGALGDLIPSVTDTYVVGNGLLKWKDGWFSGSVYTNNIVADNSVSVGFNIVSTNGVGSFGSHVSAGTAGSGNLLANNGSVIIGPGFTVRQSNVGAGTVGTSGIPWGDVYSSNAHLNVVTPINSGTPVASSSVGASGSRYQNAYIDTINSTTHVPYTDNTGTVGSAVLRYNAGYFTNLTVNALPVCSFLASGQYATTLQATVTNPAFVLTPYTVAVSTITWMRVGSIYSMSLIWTIQLTSGWSATAETTFQLIFDLPVTMDAADGTRGGSCAGGALDAPTMFGTTGYQGDSTVRLNFSNVTVPAISASAYASFRAIFQCKRTAA